MLTRDRHISDYWWWDDQNKTTIVNTINLASRDNRLLYFWVFASLHPLLKFWTVLWFSLTSSLTFNFHAWMTDDWPPPSSPFWLDTVLRQNARCPDFLNRWLMLIDYYSFHPQTVGLLDDFIVRRTLQNRPNSGPSCLAFSPTTMNNFRSCRVSSKF